MQVPAPATKTRQDLEPFAGIGVAHRCHEEAKPKDQHEDVQHEMLLSRFVSVRAVRMAIGKAGIADAIPAVRISACEVPLHAYVFEADARGIL